MTDNTVPAPNPDDTEIVPPPTAAAAELAWSQDEPDEDPAAAHEPWRAALVAAAAIVVISGSIAFVIFSWQRHRPAEHVIQGGIMEPSTMPAEALPPIETVPPEPIIAPPSPAPTVTVTATPTQTPAPVQVAAPAPRGDDVFLAEARAGGLEILDESVAIADAHQGCDYLAAGHTPTQAAQLALAHNPTLTPRQARVYVRATIDAYCPQY